MTEATATERTTTYQRCERVKELLTPYGFSRWDPTSDDYEGDWTPKGSDHYGCVNYETGEEKDRVDVIRDGFFAVLAAEGIELTPAEWQRLAWDANRYIGTWQTVAHFCHVFAER
jgi:hypothetical protein